MGRSHPLEGNWGWLLNTMYAIGVEQGKDSMLDELRAIQLRLERLQERLEQYEWSRGIQ